MELLFTPINNIKKIYIHVYIYYIYNIYIYNIYVLLHDWEGNTGKFLFKIDRIGPTKGRDDNEVKNGIFPHIVRPGNCNNRFIV